MRNSARIWCHAPDWRRGVERIAEVLAKGIQEMNIIKTDIPDVLIFGTSRVR